MNTFLEENSDICLREHEVKIQGVNGGMVNSLYKYLIDVYNFRPQLVFLQIGSNDIGNIANSVDNVCLAIEQLVTVLLSLDVQHVMVGMLFDRNRVLKKHGLTVDQYNERVYLLNYKLYKLSMSYQHNMTFWVHR